MLAITDDGHVLDWRFYIPDFSKVIDDAALSDEQALDRLAQILETRTDAFGYDGFSFAKRLRDVAELYGNDRELLREETQSVIFEIYNFADTHRIWLGM